MPLGFLRRGTVFTANAIAIVTVSCMSGLIISPHDLSSTDPGIFCTFSGLAFLPVALVFLVVGGFLSARLVTRFGMKPVLVVSMAFLTIGFLLLSRITLGTAHRSAAVNARGGVRSRLLRLPRSTLQHSLVQNTVKRGLLLVWSTLPLRWVVPSVSRSQSRSQASQQQLS